MNLNDCHNFSDFRKLAKKKLPSPIFHYIDGAADDEITYAIQYTCENIDKLNEYQEKYAPNLQEKHTNRYRGKFGAFRTLLEIVHQH